MSTAYSFEKLFMSCSLGEAPCSQLRSDGPRKYYFMMASYLSVSLSAFRHTSTHLGEEFLKRRRYF